MIDGAGSRSLQPFEIDRLCEFCAKNNIHPCRFGVHVGDDGSLRAEGDGWNLYELSRGAFVDPLETISDELIPISSWELHDFGIAVVRSRLEGDGLTVTEWQSVPEIDPNIWFVENGKLAWITVRSVAYPVLDAEKPRYLADIVESCRAISETGYFASVSIANADDPFTVPSEASPIYRGRAVMPRFQGLVPVTARSTI